MSVDEKRLARDMHHKRGMTQTQISLALGRDLSSINRLLAQKKEPRPTGRPRALTTEQVDHVETTLNKMI